MYREQYHAYLRSNDWRDFRQVVLERTPTTKDGFIRCQICFESPKKFNIHHLTYERLGSERKKDITALCPTCHKTFHRYARYFKVNPNNRVENRKLIHLLRTSRPKSTRFHGIDTERKRIEFVKNGFDKIRIKPVMVKLRKRVATGTDSLKKGG